jgi:excisionase family DNA binding protein
LNTADRSDFSSTGKVGQENLLFGQVFPWQADIGISKRGIIRLMAEAQKTLSVSEAAGLCGVGRTTVGYWIRSKKLQANRVGRNYTIPLEDLLFFLKNSAQKIPAELQRENCSRPIFKSFKTCWQHWQGSEHGLNCPGCIAFKNQLQACFTVKDSGLLGCSDCNTCRYYTETYLHRIQFVHQFDVPAAVFKDLYLWGGNSQCAEICEVQQKDLVGMGIEKIVHAGSLPKVIKTVKKLALGESQTKEDCIIAIKNEHEHRKLISLAVYPLREPAMSFLALGVPLNAKRKILPHQRS